MSGTAESIRFPPQPREGELFGALNRRVYQWQQKEWHDVTHVFRVSVATIEEPPADGGMYVRVRSPGRADGAWVALPRTDLSAVYPLDGSRHLNRPLLLPSPPEEAMHATPKIYVDRLCAALRQEIGRLAALITPRPPDPVGEARGRTYR